MRQTHPYPRTTKSCDHAGVFIPVIFLNASPVRVSLAFPLRGTGNRTRAAQQHIVRSAQRKCECSLFRRDRINAVHPIRYFDCNTRRGCGKEPLSSPYETNLSVRTGVLIPVHCVASTGRAQVLIPVLFEAGTGRQVSISTVGAQASTEPRPFVCPWPSP